MGVGGGLDRLASRRVGFRSLFPFPTPPLYLYLSLLLRLPRNPLSARRSSWPLSSGRRGAAARPLETTPATSVRDVPNVPVPPSSPGRSVSFDPDPRAGVQRAPRYPPPPLLISGVLGEERLR